MAERIEFVRNYTDLSTDHGFQFEFTCDRCGSGYRTAFQDSGLGRVSQGLNMLGGMLGGVLGRAAEISDKVKDAAWKKAADDAFRKAVTEIRPSFAQCPHCMQWVCRQTCWNTGKGLCKECAPDTVVEMAAAQASRTREEVWAHAQMAEEDMQIKTKDWREGVRALCPECEKPLKPGAKFCPECGAAVKPAKTACPGCGASVAEGVKFCPECGQRMAQPTHCGACGAELTPGVKFCGECGQKV